MKPGTELTLDINDVAYGGDGIARHEGRVIFVPFTIPGETVRARLVRVKPQWARAEVTGIAAPSPDRVEPPCPLFARCGGCAYQHIAYPRQLGIKTRQVAEALRRIGKINEPPVEPALPSPGEFAYRNRITVHVDPPLVGFRGTDPRELVDVGRCLLADDTVNAALAHLRSKKRLRPGPATLRSGPADAGFTQVNHGAAELLASIVAEMAGSGPLLVDAYSGSGFFAKRVAGSFTRVVGIDWDERSIATAAADGGANETHLAGDTAALLPEVLAGTGGDAVVLLDPPAQGLAPEVIAALLDALPQRIVYVSCDPATLARDLAKLCGPYTLHRAAPVDMFPQTASIETACLLVRSDG